ncbi:BAI1-associated protein 3-like isoform X3 [Ptychodera flava]|uniref:BAI1-associated protein 3-like isoform X3 n=1 Tax=Ptychodera flava TaxID=63121 RepID=UPI00396A08AB
MSNASHWCQSIISKIPGKPTCIFGQQKDEDCGGYSMKEYKFIDSRLCEISDSDCSDGLDPIKLHKTNGRRRTFSFCPKLMPLKHLKRRSRQRDALILHDSFEGFYISLLQSIVHPLGKTENADNITATDMIKHIQEVFQIDTETHEKCIGSAVTKKPPATVLKIRIIEAKNIKAMDSNGLSDPYCIVSVVKPKHSPKSSPKLSPKHSRKTINKRANSIETSNVIKTQTKFKTRHPRWLEEYTFDVTDLSKEEVHLYMWDHDEESSVMDAIKSLDAEHRLAGLRNIFRQIRQTVEYGKPVDDFLGKIYIPLREIPTLGCDQWFKLQRQSLASAVVAGEIRLKLQLSLKEQDETDGLSSENMERYYMLAKEIYKFNADKSEMVEKHSGPWNGVLSKTSTLILDQFAIQHGVSKVSQSVINLCVLLEYCIQYGLERSALQQALSLVDMATNDMETLNDLADMQELQQKFSLSSHELGLLEQCISLFIDAALHDLQDCPDVYPPTKPENLAIMEKNCCLDIIHSLLSLKLLNGNGSALSEKMIEKLTEKIRGTANKWMSDKLKDVIPVKKGAMRPADMLTTLKDLKTVIEQCTQLCYIKTEYQEFFKRFGLNYYGISVRLLDIHISKAVQEILQKLDEYQLRYQRYNINIVESSRGSLTLYLTTKKMIQVMEQSITDRDELDLINYNNWFQGTLIFWLQTFRSECEHRVRKALEMDPNVMKVDSLVKFSISSVDVLSCFAKITEEWNEINYEDPDSACVGVAKITELICDGARLYADNLHSTLEQNGFYDDDDNDQFDIKEKFCITLNNIEYVRQYLDELPKLLHWESTVGRLVTKHNNQTAGTKTLNTLKKLVKNASSDMCNKAVLLVNNVAEKMSEEMKKSMCIFNLLESNEEPSVDPLMMYLDSNLEILYKQLMAPIYPRIIHELWNALLRTIADKMETGAPSKYYQTLEEHLSVLTKYFENLGLSPIQMNNYQCTYVKNQLSSNSLSSPDLIREYYQNMADNVCTPDTYFGHLAIKIGYMRETHGKITLFVKVVNAVDLPGLDKNGLSDPFVTLELLPESIFTTSKSKKTKVIPETLNPKFNEIFEFPGLAEDVLTSNGAVISLTVMDQNLFWHDGFAGEMFIHVKSAREIPVNRNVEACPVIMLPLKRPTSSDATFQILKSRSSWDKISKKFITKRMKMIDDQPMRTDVKKSQTATEMAERGFMSIFSKISANKT